MVPWLAAAAIPFLPKGTVSGAVDKLTAQNAFRASGVTEAAGYDPNAKYVGGSAEASQAAAYDRSREADIALNRQGPQVNYDKSNYAAKQANYARQEQSKAYALMRARATGQAPSIAQMQAQRDMAQAAAAQSSAAASARGPAGLAMAQQNASMNTAATHRDISGQAQINAARERQAAEQAMFGAASGIRQGDMGQQGIYGQQSQYQAGLDSQQRARNDARSLSYDQGAWDVGNRDQAASMQEQGNIAQGHIAANNANAQINQSNAQGAQKLGTGIMGGLQGVVGGLGMAMSDVNAKTDVQPLALKAAAGPYAPIGWDQNVEAEPNGYSAPAIPQTQGNPFADTHKDFGGNVRVQNKNSEQLSKLFSDVRSKEPDPMLANLATMEPSSYRYKEGLGEDTAQTHVGPMAQNMAAAPVTATAVDRDPQTGMLALDGKRSLKLALGGVGYLAQKQAQQDAEIERLKRKGGV